MPLCEGCKMEPGTGCCMLDEFHAGAIEFDDANVTELVTRDAPIVWRDAPPGVGLGYDMVTGELIAARIPGKVAMREPLNPND